MTMKRLRDLPASSPLLEQAQRLIEAAPALPDSSASMLRIRRALDRVPARGSSVLRAPAFLVGGALVLFGASAFAAVRMWVDHRAPRHATEQQVEAPALAVVSAPRTNPGSASPELAQAEESARVQLPVSPVSDEPRVEASARAKRAPKGHKARRTKLSRPARRAASRLAAAPAQPAAAAPDAIAAPSPATEAPLPAQAERATQLRVAEPQPMAAPPEAEEVRAEPVKRSSDSELVVRAVRALRRDHDPDAAARLLERYRTRNPSGVLAEEVLSLQIEAAVAAKNARAAAFAREYLARYPAGRYRARAKQALSGDGP
jgi:hypothetical protein